MFGAPSEWFLCLPQTDRNSCPLRLHVSVSARWQSKQSKNQLDGCRETGTNWQCWVLQELFCGAFKKLRSSSGSSYPPAGGRGDRQRSVNTSIWAVHGIYFRLVSWGFFSPPSKCVTNTRLSDTGILACFPTLPPRHGQQHRCALCAETHLFHFRGGGSDRGQLSPGRVGPSLRCGIPLQFIAS